MDSYDRNCYTVTYEDVPYIGGDMPTLQEADELLKQYIQSQNLRHHCMAVSAVMGHFATQYDEQNVEKWKIIGLIHDLDWELYPDEHCFKTAEILRERNWPEDYIRAVMSHGWKICTDVKPEDYMEKVLYAVDELTGLIIAVALVRPSRSLLDVKPSSIRKKWNATGFAAGADRTIIESGAMMMGMPLDELIQQSLDAMQKIASDIDMGNSG